MTDFEISIFTFQFCELGSIKKIKNKKLMLQKHLCENKNKNEGCRFSTSGVAIGCSTSWILCQKGKRQHGDDCKKKLDPFNDKVMLMCFPYFMFSICLK
jgi:hypothetical protein